MNIDQLETAAQKTATEALLLALLDRVSENNVEIVKEIFANAEGRVAANVTLDTQGPVAAKAFAIVTEWKQASIKRLTPESHHGAGFQRQV